MSQTLLKIYLLHLNQKKNIGFNQSIFFQHSLHQQITPIIIQNHSPFSRNKNIPMTSEKSSNPFHSTLFPNLTIEQQQQFFLAQFLLSGGTCPPFNPLVHALQYLLQQQHNFAWIGENEERISPVNFQHVRISSPIDSNLSDSHEKSSSDDDDNSPTIASTLATLSNETTIDGINLDEMKQFAKAFKLRRLALGLTQTQVGQALSVTRGPAYSQSAICRFEKLDITPKSASKIKPVLEKWMRDAEFQYADRLKTDTTNFEDLINDLNNKKRKRRTSFTPRALEKLNDAFELNTHPSGMEMSILAEQLNYDREVIRVWFCNKRQALKNSAKRFKSNPINEEHESNSSKSE